jgi:uncharacterized protein (TIGR02453 family)
MAVATSTFTGFRPEAIQFLADLAVNNDRAWFQPRKADYERLLKHPLEELCVALGERFAARGIPLTADPVRSPFRIYRDVRFSKDKSPYKTNVGASFPWAEGGVEGHAHAGGGYFHLQPGEIFVGGGMWHPEPAYLAAWRRALDNEPERVHAAIDDPDFVAQYGRLSHEESALKRVPAGFAADHSEADLLRLKDVVFGRRLSDVDAFSPGLPDLLADALGAALPVFRLLARLTD